MRQDLLKTVFLGAALPVVGSFLLRALSGSQGWINYPAHAALEAMGCLAGIAIACFILILLRNLEIHRRYIWIAAGLTAMGTLDGVHALLEDGETFVWTHSLANLFGGLLFAGVWLPARFAPPRRYAGWVVFSCFTLTGLVGVLTLQFGASLPPLLRDGVYTPIASLLNLTGGLGFIATAAYISLRSRSISPIERLVFSSHASLFGIASVMFEMAAPWDAAWWLWHGLRTLAYLVAFAYFIDLFQRQLRTLKTTETRLNHALDTIFETTQEGVLFVDHFGLVTSANPAACEMFGFGGEIPQGLSPARLLPNALSAASHLRPDTNLQAMRLDGSRFEVELSQTRLRAGGPFSSFITVRDITERKQAERQVLHLIEKLQSKTIALEQSNAELDTFAYVASHDLRAPLRTIQNAVHWLEEDLSPHFTEDTRDTMNIILRRTRRMEHLLEDLMLHSRIGRTEAAKDVVVGTELVDNIRALAMRREGFGLTFDAGFDSIEVQKLPLLHVLLNLVDNAIKHNDAPTGTIALTAREGRDTIEFTVSDDGPGIAEKYQARIFEMFTTLHPRDEIEGSGMGLAIAKKYASVSGGTIEVFSQGRGCRFTVTWPKPTSVPQVMDKSA